VAVRKRSRVAKQIAAMRRSVNALARSIRNLAPAIRQLERAAAAPRRGRGRRRPLRLSPARRAALKLQGQYMGYLRQLTASQKKQVKIAREKKGLRQAIALAKRLAKK